MMASIEAANQGGLKQAVASYQAERWKDCVALFNKSSPHTLDSQQLAMHASANASLRCFVDAVGFASTVVGVGILMSALWHCVTNCTITPGCTCSVPEQLQSFADFIAATLQQHCSNV